MNHQMEKGHHFGRLLIIGAAIAWQSSAWASTNWFQSSDRSHKSDSILQVENAHRAFIEGRFDEMASQMKAVFLNASSTSTDKDNMLKLLNKAYSDGMPNFAADWSLPPGVSEIRVGVRRKQSPDGIYFHTNIKIDLAKERHLTDFKVVQYPDKILFDKSAGIGKWEDNPEKVGHKVSVRNASSSDPIEKGLYLIDMTLDNGVRTQGWFILSDEYSSACPEVLFPAVGDHLKTTTPTFRWQDFRSPEYKSSETRILGLDLASTKSDDWPTVWDFYEGYSNRTDATIGGSVGDGATSLNPGPYNLTVIYREVHRFGPLKLQRESATYVPFEIDHP